MAPIAITAEFVVVDHHVGTNETNHILELTNARNPSNSPQHVLPLKHTDFSRIELS